MFGVSDDVVLNVALAIVMALASALFVLWARQQRTEHLLIEQAIAALDVRLTEQKARGDLAGKRCSDRADEIQSRIGALISHVDRLPEEMREKFQSVELARALYDESRRDRTALWEAIRLGVKTYRRDA